MSMCHVTTVRPSREIFSYSNFNLYSERLAPSAGFTIVYPTIAKWQYDCSAAQLLFGIYTIIRKFLCVHVHLCEQTQACNAVSQPSMGLHSIFHCSGVTEAHSPSRQSLQACERQLAASQAVRLSQWAQQLHEYSQCHLFSLCTCCCTALRSVKQAGAEY